MSSCRSGNGSIHRSYLLISSSLIKNNNIGHSYSILPVIKVGGTTKCTKRWGGGREREREWEQEREAYHYVPETNWEDSKCTRTTPTTTQRMLPPPTHTPLKKKKEKKEKKKKEKKEKSSKTATTTKHTHEKRAATTSSLAVPLLYTSIHHWKRRSYRYSTARSNIKSVIFHTLIL